MYKCVFVCECVTVFVCVSVCVYMCVCLCVSVMCVPLYVERVVSVNIEALGF